jgi:O-antigen/teichoic acid export membrane protein
LLNPDQWRRWIEPLRTSTYVHNLARLISGAGLAQLIGLLSTPLVTRLYQSADYGLAASFAATVAIFAPIVAFRYDLAIILPEDDTEASSVFWLSCTFIWLSLLVELLLVFAATALLPSHPFIQQLGWIIFLLPAVISVTASASILIAWANRKRQYSLLARNRSFAAIINPLFIVSAYFLIGSNPLGLILAPLTSVLIGCLFLLRNMERPPFRGINLSSLKSVFSKYRQMPQFNLWMSLLDQFTTSLPILLFTSVFGTTVSAYFALANSVLFLPSYFVGQSVSQVFFQQAARQKHDIPGLKKFVIANLRGLSLLMVLPILLTVLAGPLLFGIVFGSKWSTAGEYAQFLIPAAALTFIASPISLIPTIFNKQHIHIALAMLNFVGRIVGLWIGIQANSPVLAVALYSFGESIGLLIFLGWIVKFIGNIDKPNQLPVDSSD